MIKQECYLILPEALHNSSVTRPIKDHELESFKHYSKTAL